MIARIANWAKLLTECVQCYGTKLQNRKYYRGLKKVLKFNMFAVRFNLPTSTTSKFVQACEFSMSEEHLGLVLELRKYKERYDVFKFDCSKLSVFDEGETLFFGGNTVLQISSMWHWQLYKGKWKSYRKYIQPIN
eukprot:300498_1